MGNRRVWTASELEKMTPDERHAIFESSIVWDLADAPVHLVERARQSALDHIAATERSEH